MESPLPTVAFLTQHGKETLLAPLFRRQLGCDLVRAVGFDTDQLGSFTRDLQRPGTQLAVARLKARKAIELSGMPVGLGSEGAFGVDPVGGILPWNTEVLVWIDTDRGLEVVGAAQGPGGGLQRTVRDGQALRQFALDAGFPSHGLVLRPDGPDDPRMRKDLTDWPTLLTAFEAALAESAAGCAFVEADLRAHRNPTRQQMIVRAAKDLLAKLRSACPQCGAPGFWEKERIAGLPCALCRQPTRMPLARLWRCDACRYTEERRETGGELADPARCDCCNP